MVQEQVVEVHAGGQQGVPGQLEPGPEGREFAQELILEVQQLLLCVPLLLDRLGRNGGGRGGFRCEARARVYAPVVLQRGLMGDAKSLAASRPSPAAPYACFRPDFALQSARQCARKATRTHGHAQCVHTSAFALISLWRARFAVTSSEFWLRTTASSSRSCLISPGTAPAPPPAAVAPVSPAPALAGVPPVRLLSLASP